MKLQNRNLSVEVFGEKTNVHINLPLRYDFRRAESEQDAQNQIKQNMRLDINAALGAVYSLSEALVNGNAEAVNIAEQLALLSRIGAMFTESLEDVDNFFDDLVDTITCDDALALSGEEKYTRPADENYSVRLSVVRRVTEYLKNHTDDEAHNLLEALDDIHNQQFEYTPELIEKLVLSAAGDVQIQYLIDIMETGAIKPIKIDQTKLSFSTRVLNFLNDDNAPEERKQVLIDYLGHEFNEADISPTNENLLESSLAELAAERKGEAWEIIKQLALGVIEGRETWSIAGEMKSIREAVTAEKPLDLSAVETPTEDSCIDLAKHLSAILRNPKCPNKLHEVISDEIDQFSQPKDHFTSPEYLACVLCANDEVSE